MLPLEELIEIHGPETMSEALGEDATHTGEAYTYLDFPLWYRRNGMGVWCAYIMVPNYMLEYKDDAPSHCGFTWESQESPDGKVARSNHTWLGFDTIHSGDLWPYQVVDPDPVFADDEYRTLAYCKEVLHKSAEFFAKKRLPNPPKQTTLDNLDRMAWVCFTRISATAFHLKDQDGQRFFILRP